MGDTYLCELCLVCTHQGLSKVLHIVETWKGEYFVVRGLKSFGVRLQLRHQSRRCPSPVPDNAYIITDYHAWHPVALDYCGCSTISPERQLMRARLLPSRTRPSAATVFDLGFPHFIMREMERVFGVILIDRDE
ncbi:hypothetical protein C8J57DRAFT_193361 [Mycena rebaudengoi]|nr:hypothetical protein C8J57DRAFT_193361 [Mycena rebaudengoi]